MTRIRCRFLAFLTMFVCAAITGHAQIKDTSDVPQFSRSTYGLFGDAAWNIHRANFQSLPDVPNCCPLFESGSGMGGAFGAFWDYDAFGDGHLGVRVGVNLLDGKLTADEPMTIAVNGAATQGTIEHSISTQFTAWMLEPYYAFDLHGLRLMLGANAGSIHRNTYNQSESIVQPSDQGTFYPGNSRTRNVYSGDIPQANSFRLGLIAGVAYQVPLNESQTFHAYPEVLFDYGLTPMVSGLSWTVSALRGGVSIGYTPLHIPPPPPPPPPPVPPPPPAPKLSADIMAYSISEDGKRDSTNLSVSVEEFYSMTLTPLLPFVLFEKDNAQIPTRYHGISADETKSFDLRKTDSTDNVRVYHDILNIIGKRLREKPTAKITLTGCTSNEPEELADKKLASERANAVADYLKNTWGIASNRITLLTRGLPAKPSSLTQQEGKEENRRVEITATDPTILGPVILPDTQLTSNPPTMDFVPTVVADAGVKFWDLYVTQPVLTLHHESGVGTQPKGWHWDLRKVAARIPRTEDTIEYGLTIDDNAGQEVTAVKTIPVHQTTIRKKRLEHLADKVIERYTLVLFDFGASKIDPQNQRAIEYIRNQLVPGTKAYITGYADRTGEDALNLHLTEDRANAVAKMLGADNVEAKGVGKSVLLFDNNLPEGRFYSRTVNIVLEKPVH